MQSKKSFILTRLLPGVVIAALATTAGIWSARQVIKHRNESDPLAATRFPAARPLQSFNLADHRGGTFDNQSLLDHWSFLFFGYTHCPDVCPTTMSVLNSVARRLQDSHDNIRFVMVTVDPERDTPEKLGKFVTYFNGNFLGVTGNEQSLEQLTKQLGIMYMRINKEDSPDSYLVDHTAGVFLFDPDGRYHAVFTPPLTVDKITADFNRMAGEFRQ